MSKKLDRVLTRLATLLVASGIVLIIIGAVQTKAYNYEPLGCRKVVWGYCWGERAVQLYSGMRQLGFSDYETKLVINKAKKRVITGSVENAIIATAGIAMAESGGFKHCRKGQCMGVKKFGFKNLSENLDDWLSRYTKYWYTWRWKGGASFFYSLNGRPSLSRYCTEEASSGMYRYHCPNGWRHFNYVFYHLTK